VANPTDEKEMPQYQHDCDACTFLGRFAGQFNDFDLYHCEQVKIPTVIARYSSYGPDYKSGIGLTHFHEELAEALKRAQARGLRCE
jgi:hypothetical protein